MAWRYENPGRAELTVYPDVANVNDLSYDESVTGCAFAAFLDSSGNHRRYPMFNVPDNIYEMWMRADITHRASNTPDLYMGNLWQQVGNQSKSVGVTTAYNSVRFFINGSTDYSSVLGVLPLKKCETIRIHMVSDATGWTIEASCGSKTALTQRIELGDRVPFQCPKIFVNQTDGAISNIIISDTPIDEEEGWRREEFTARLDIKAPALCVRKNDAVHTFPFATAENLPANAFAARIGGKIVYNPLVSTGNSNAGHLQLRKNGTNYALSRNITES